ncbi:hypothetical protein MTO96_024280 [Rhipicephalus appendiculatus]
MSSSTAANRMNLAALQRVDSAVTEIVDNASQVALYKFAPATNGWVSHPAVVRLFFHLPTTALSSNNSTPDDRCCEAVVVATKPLRPQNNVVPGVSSMRLKVSLGAAVSLSTWFRYSGTSVNRHSATSALRLRSCV